MAYCPHGQNLVSTDDDGHCMGDMNVCMRKLLAMTKWENELNYEFMKIIGDQ